MAGTSTDVYEFDSMVRVLMLIKLYGSHAVIDTSIAWLLWNIAKTGCLVGYISRETLENMLILLLHGTIVPFFIKFINLTLGI